MQEIGTEKMPQSVIVHGTLYAEKAEHFHPFAKSDKVNLAFSSVHIFLPHGLTYTL